MVQKGQNEPTLTIPQVQVPPNNSDVLQPESDGLQPTSDGLQPNSDGLPWNQCTVESHVNWGTRNAVRSQSELSKGSWPLLRARGVATLSSIFHQHVSEGNTTGARTLLGAPGHTTRNKKLLGAPGIATRSKDATRGSWHRY